MNRSLRFLPMIFATVLAGACGEPPTKELAAAQTQIEEARKEGAELYAADRWREATSALAVAQTKVEQKDYKSALSAANDAAEKARSAKSTAAAAKVVARGTAETGLTEAAVLLDDVEAIRQEAAAAKVPEEAFAELQPKLEEVRQARERAAATLERGDLLEAQRATAELKAAATALPALFRQAREKWVADHPKGKKKKT